MNLKIDYINIYGVTFVIKIIWWHINENDLNLFFNFYICYYVIYNKNVIFNSKRIICEEIYSIIKWLLIKLLILCKQSLVRNL